MSRWIKVTVVLHSLEPPRFGLSHPYCEALIVVYKVRSYFNFVPIHQQKTSYRLLITDGMVYGVHQYYRT